VPLANLIFLTLNSLKRTWMSHWLIKIVFGNTGTNVVRYIIIQKKLQSVYLSCISHWTKAVDSCCLKALAYTNLDTLHSVVSAYIVHIILCVPISCSRCRPIYLVKLVVSFFATRFHSGKKGFQTLSKPSLRSTTLGQISTFLGYLWWIVVRVSEQNLTSSPNAH